MFSFFFYDNFYSFLFLNMMQVHGQEAVFDDLPIAFLFYDVTLTFVRWHVVFEVKVQNITPC